VPRVGPPDALGSAEVRSPVPEAHADGEPQLDEDQTYDEPECYPDEFVGPPAEPGLADDTSLRRVPRSSREAAASREVEELVVACEKETVAVEVESTVGWGCPCPPFVFRQFDDVEGHDVFVLPVFAPGVPDGGAWYVPGVFRFAGQYTGRGLTLDGWHEQRGEPSSGYAEDRYRRIGGPEFWVIDWCFRPPRRPPAWVEEDFAAMRGAGVRLCGGAHWPRSYEPEDST
jgi:hypothetical protein